MSGNGVELEKDAKPYAQLETPPKTLRRRRFAWIALQPHVAERLQPSLNSLVHTNIHHHEKKRRTGQRDIVESVPPRDEA